MSAGTPTPGGGAPAGLIVLSRPRRVPVPTARCARWLRVVLCVVLLVLLAGGAVGLARAEEEEPARYTPTNRSGIRPAVARWESLLADYDWDVAEALRVIQCESGGLPAVWNRQGSGAHGLFQLLAWEWKAYELYGVWSVADPVVNVGVAYWIWAASGRTFGSSMGWRSSIGCWS